ncbi:MAG: chromosome segregation protein SMC [Bernardetiaceae bacterium]
MLLTRLDINGFKSFGDKVKIEFTAGITGVVGPNGCGKSNIVDAIRWVLGEQRTSQLRSDKMSNVIFNGTSSRKNAPFAEVALTFENNRGLLPPAFTDVTITRRYTRSGQSEYLINGETCRRRDILELLLKAGISSNNYAIIELRMVDEILNDTENARRRMFEEASGIAQYKARKKETEQKLKGTEADLERVEDILHEVQKNMRTLERQAKQAALHKDALTRYKSYSIALAKQQFRQHSQEFADLTDKIQKEQAERDTFTQQLQQIEQDLDHNKAALDEQERVLTNKRRQLGQVFHQVRQLESDQKVQEERFRFLKDKKESLAWKIKQEDQNIAAAQQEIIRIEGQEQEAQQLLDEAQQKLDRAQTNYERYKEQVDILKQEADILQQQIYNQQEQIQQYQRQIEVGDIKITSLEQDLEQILSENEDYQERLHQHHDQIEALEQQVQQVAQQIDSKVQERQKIENQRLDNQKDIENLQQARYQYEKTRDTKANEVRLRSQWLDSLEGFGEAVKFLSQQQEWAAQAILLPDLLDCPPEHAQALAAVLDAFSDCYVVPDAQTAAEGLALLRQAKQGKARFLVLEQIPDLPDTPSETGYGWAWQKVNVVDQKYEKLLRYLLHHTIFLPSDTEQKHDYPAHLTLIAHDGTYWQQGPHWRGGAGKSTNTENSRLGKQQQIYALQQEIEALATNIEEKDKDIQNLQEKNKQLQEQVQQIDIEQLQAQANQINRQRITHQAQAQQLQQTLQINTGKIAQANEKIALLQEQNQHIQPEIDQLEDESQNDQDKKEEIERQITARSRQLADYSENFNQQNMAYFRYKSHIENLQKELTYKKENQQRNQERLQQSKQELQKTEQDIDQLLLQQEQTAQELQQTSGRKQDLQEEVNAAENHYYQQREGITERERQTRDLQRQRENLDTRLNALQHRLTEVKMQLTAVRERISAEFQLEMDQTWLEQAPQPEDELPEEELKEGIQAARQQLDKLGNINLMALEAYEEIKERHTFIESQRDDLLSAQASLQKTIAEIERAARKAFMEAFEAIRTNFQDIFRTLFSEEDQCDLILENPDDPTESKIEILAQPKGKRPLTIKQLSGGEKTLTATSLLFAIYLLRPAPFCVFDEVDAPLDDANIDKFNKIIKRFAGQVQFVIVTHNKRTMANTDTIYGVTMPEKGISKVLPVDLRQLNIQEESVSL